MNRSQVVERLRTARKDEKECQTETAKDIGIAAVSGYIEYRFPGAILPAACIVLGIVGVSINTARGRSNSITAAALEGALAQYYLSQTADQSAEQEQTQPD